MKIRIGDQVVALQGKDKGKSSKIEKVMARKNMVVVTGLNVYKKHLKRQDSTSAGGIVEITKPLPVSKVAIVCPKCNLPSRIGIVQKGDKRVRICKKCKQEI